MHKAMLLSLFPFVRPTMQCKEGKGYIFFFIGPCRFAVLQLVFGQWIMNMVIAHINVLISLYVGDIDN